VDTTSTSPAATSKTWLKKAYFIALTVPEICSNGKSPLCDERYTSYPTRNKNRKWIRLSYGDNNKTFQQKIKSHTSGHHNSVSFNWTRFVLTENMNPVAHLLPTLYGTPMFAKTCFLPICKLLKNIFKSSGKAILRI